MILQIVVPTFNRLVEATRQIGFLACEVTNFPKIALLLSDNASSEDVSAALQDKCSSVNAKYRRNETNLGLVGNLLRCVERCDSDYIWFVGDDDVLEPGAVARVFDRLVANSPEYLFLNHFAVDIAGSIKLSSALPVDGHEDSELNALNVIAYSGTALMLITANVYRISKLRAAILNDRFARDRLSAPLYWSLYCAQGGRLNFIDDLLVKNVWGATSWSKQAKDVLQVQVPIELIRSVGMRYPKAIAIELAIPALGRLAWGLMLRLVRRYSYERKQLV